MWKLEFERYTNAGGPRGGFTKEEFVDFFMKSKSKIKTFKKLFPWK
ncbi:hypothetical protein IAI10_23345 [Clostridium sp. 19966]|nr:hypothetical protein [Clostridium sp. 19966]MDT8719582.1 hypothetical protein [Clostridium sp. 19966]